MIIFLAFDLNWWRFSLFYPSQHQNSISFYLLSRWSCCNIVILLWSMRWRLSDLLLLIDNWLKRSSRNCLILSLYALLCLILSLIVKFFNLISFGNSNWWRCRYFVWELNGCDYIFNCWTLFSFLILANNIIPWKLSEITVGIKMFLRQQSILWVRCSSCPSFRVYLCIWAL